MEFSNLYFLYIWLPLILLAYMLIRDMRWKNYLLLGFGLFFYAMGQPLCLVLLMGLSWLNFRLARRIRPGKAKTVLIPVAINIGVLAVFKYLDFFLGIFGLSSGDGVLLTAMKGLVSGLNSIGFGFAEPTSVLPIGISFYTFSMVSYLVDVYRQDVKPEKDFCSLLLYLTMFPKMLQGPIVRYRQIAPQLKARRTTPKAAFEGGLRFTVGLAKKVLLADYCGKIISELASVGSDTSFVGAWLSAALFMFQIYFDFSGYSDMAIGLGRIFGFTYCENFNQPYISASVTEFWRRWHMSLGSFFRDYVYIPLGGNRKGKPRQILNLLIVWALTGLWHGASWNYVLWGLYFFVVLVAEKQLMPRLKRLPNLARQAMTMAAVLFGWVLFAHEDFGELGAAITGMLGFNGFAATGVELKLLNSLPLIVVCWVGCTSLPRTAMVYWYFICGMDRETGNRVLPMKVVYVLSAFVLMCVLLWLCTVSLVGNTSAPSIYGGF